MASKPAQPEVPKIEKGVPIPPKCMQNQRYPFRDMQPGDSIVVPNKGGRGYAANWTRITGWTFTYRLQPDGSTRIWRVS